MWYIGIYNDNQSVVLSFKQLVIITITYGLHREGSSRRNLRGERLGSSWPLQLVLKQLLNSFKWVTFNCPIKLFQWTFLIKQITQY